MKFEETGIYHIYNRGNNKQKLFFRDYNYTYFLDKCHQYLKPTSDIVAWCLMPNHFHFLIEATQKSIIKIQSGCATMPALSNGFRLLQSSYAKGINKQEGRAGNLFQQKTKAKLVSIDPDYPVIAFQYIHNNPVKAGLVQRPEDWPYSSLGGYIGANADELCNRSRAYEILPRTAFEFYDRNLKVPDHHLLLNIF